MITESQQHVITLPHDFSLPVLAELQLQVNEESKKDLPVLLDAGAVERFDGAALQFVIAFSKSDIASIPAICHESDLLVAAFEDIGTDHKTMGALFNRKFASPSEAE